MHPYTVEFSFIVFYLHTLQFGLVSMQANYQLTKMFKHIWFRIWEKGTNVLEILG